MAYIREIFSSIQGEGPLVGYKQLFVRFCNCNLHCAYCDTDFDINKAKEYSVSELLQVTEQNKDCHSVSLTGGEPLLEHRFIKEFAKKSFLPIYLETNGTLTNELEEVVDFVDYIAADIKLSSATGQTINWNKQEAFLKVASKKNTFVKVVFDSNITDLEIKNITEISKKYALELILQPMMLGNIPSISSDFMLATLNKCFKLYNNVRLIPQMHKFINVD